MVPLSALFYKKQIIMIVTLSPAKTLDYRSPVKFDKCTRPKYQKQANELNDLLKPLSVEEIAKLMSINKQIAHDVHQYIHAYDMSKTPQRQAVYAYNGIAYLGLAPETLSEDDLEYAQSHLSILSGMYGMLRPLDVIKPHRLEMQIALANHMGKNLYDYWSETISRHLGDMLSDDDNTWINLSSKEYSKAVNRKLLPKNHRMITPVFKESRGNGYKQIVVYAKKARGMMARFIIQHRISDLEHLKAFDTEGYSFAPQLSDDNEWIFIR